MLPKTKQEPEMKKFYSPEYGFLHACKKDGSLWYNLTDLCQTLSMLLREAEALVKTTKGQIREFNVRRQKITSCNRYIDQDGLLTLLIECRKNQANGYRKWIDDVVTHSLNNPADSQELEEIPVDQEMTSYEVRLAYIDQYRKKQRAGKKRSTTSTTLQPSLFPQGRVRHDDATMTATEPASSNHASPILNPGPFVPADGHMTVEDFFRKEMAYPEFIFHLDGALKAARQYVRTLSHKQQKVAQQHLNVLRVFRGMLLGNAENLQYQPSEAACL